MAGIFFSLAAALAWSASSIILKYLSSRVSAISLSTARVWTGSLILLGFVLATGRVASLSRTDSISIVLVAASGVVAIAGGDTIYIRSLSFLDVSRAYPIAQCTFPVLVLAAAVLFLNEPFAWFNIAGAVLVVLGIYALAAGGQRQATRKLTGRGVGLALVAAVLWAGGSVALKLGAKDMDSFVAAAIRVPAAGLALTGLALSQRGPLPPRFAEHGGRISVLVLATGILTYAVASVCYVRAIQLIGAGKTVLLTAVSPLFLVPLSVLFLRERPTPRALAGLLISVAGMVLVAV
jgi:uncharacterized membrane protein